LTEQRTQKLWFWRRMLATTIDGLAGALVFTVLFVAVFSGSSDRVRLSGFGFTTQYCSAVKPSGEVLSEAERTMPGIAWTRASLCTVDSFGLAEHRFVSVSRQDARSAGGTVTRSAQVPVDAAGRPVSPFFADWVGVLFVMAAVVAFLASQMQATPGLYLMALQLEKEDGDKPGLPTVILRELCLLLLPVLGAGAVLGALWLWVLAVGGIGMGVILVGIIILFGAAILWWCPFLLWRDWPKAPLHDVLTHTRMVRRTA
jgi:hypothetical protein